MVLKIGDIAPDFRLASHLGPQVKLSELKGKKVIVAFHPASFTGG